jgi:RNA polymerase sigma-70 factor, ECF subfamily
MPDSQKPEITNALHRVASNDPEAKKRVFELAFKKLREVAAREAHRSSILGGTMTSTALVGEAYVKLVAAEWPNLNSTADFIAFAVKTMQRILIDAARKRIAIKRGGKDSEIVTLDDALVGSDALSESLLSLDEALEHLRAHQPRQARVVELYFFGGFNQQEIADMLGISVKTVKRDLDMALAFLRQQLDKGAA